MFTKKSALNSKVTIDTQIAISTFSLIFNGIFERVYPFLSRNKIWKENFLVYKKLYFVSTNFYCIWLIFFLLLNIFPFQTICSCNRLWKLLQWELSGITTDSSSARTFILRWYKLLTKLRSRPLDIDRRFNRKGAKWI